MYESHWGLQESPFAGSFEPRHFHESPVHEEAIARLFYLIEQRREFGLISGPAGTGKSFLLYVLHRQIQRSSRQVVSVNTLGMDAHDLLWQIALELKLAPSDTEPRRRLWRRVTDQIAALQMSRIQTVFAFDHLERCEPGSIQLIERLFAVCRQSPGLATFFASVRSDRLPRLPAFLSETADLQIELTPLQPAETDGFIRDLLSRAGCTREVFTGDAILQIHTHSRGIPRQISRLCELSMIAGLSADSHSVTREIVDSVADGLVTPLDTSDSPTDHHEYVSSPNTTTFR